MADTRHVDYTVLEAEDTAVVDRTSHKYPTALTAIEY